MIEDRQFVVIWDGVMSANAAENDKYILAYERAAETETGWVLRGGGTVQRMTAAEFNAAAARFFEQVGCTDVPPAQAVALTDDELGRIRGRLETLKAQWDAVPPGGCLELNFEVA